MKLVEIFASVVFVADAAEWTTAVSTCVLAVGGVGAFVYAVRTYTAQAAQLRIANADLARHRTPVLQGELTAIGQGGFANYRLDVWLVGPEPVTHLRVVIEEARANDAMLGFTTGQTGVRTHTDESELPAGWRNDEVRHAATVEGVLAPGTAATWQMAVRSRVKRDRLGDPTRLRLRAECRSVDGQDFWSTSVPVHLSEEALRDLRS